MSNSAFSTSDCPPPEGYHEWLAYIFEAPESAVEPPKLHIETILLVEYLFRNLRSEIAHFDNEQVAKGVRNIFCPYKSQIVPAIVGNCCALDVRMATLRAIGSVYPECFETRCEPILSHLDEPHKEGLAGTCYMLWDASGALLRWGPGRDAVIDVLQVGLDCSNPACHESALHGLGHLAHCEPRVQFVIDEFLERRADNLRFELIQYARAARAGDIQ
ncbi:hypothetical protein [Methylobacterium sp. P5_C11]